MEDDADKLIPFSTGWVQHGANQRALIERFFASVERERSLCFFYAKHVPLLDDEHDRRILVGAGRVLTVADAVRFGGENPLDTVAWESMVQHSIRPAMQDGFLLPYHQALAHQRREPRFDPATVVAFAPEDAWLDFSYASEHVSHDTAISSLVACEAALRAADAALPGSRTSALTWISDRLGEIWRLRGPCPGLAAALQAFGIAQGTLAVRRLTPLLTENEDPWTLVERAMGDPAAVDPALARHLTPSLCEKWRALPEERRALLRLLSRFDLTPEQAERWYQPHLREAARIPLRDADILANPYVLFEADREQAAPIPVVAIDHGAFPDPVVQEAHPLPSPSALADGLDVRRVRALLVHELARAGDAGDTLRSQTELIHAVSERPLTPPCPLDADQLSAHGERLEPVLRRVAFADGTHALQLGDAADDAALIRRCVEKRVSGARRPSVLDWEQPLRDAFGAIAEGDADELRAREEKAAALAELFAARFAVLVGAAGTGKTTLLQVLCDEPAVDQGGVLLLAPTGKARVRLKQALGRGAQTLAQFLMKHGRYDSDTGVYSCTGGGRRTREFGTVIVDEASMLTERQLAALIDTLEGVERLVLVGDDRQLPPIGAGRPFIDIVRRLSPPPAAAGFPRVARGYAELLVPRRQTEVDGESSDPAQLRADLTLAEWFGGRPLSPGADEVWDRLASGAVDRSLRVIGWEDGTQLTQLLLDLLVADLGLDGDDEQRAFELACGGSEYEGSVYFWERKRGQPGAAERVGDWQILTPVRGHAHGVTELNRVIQRRFRERTRDRATQRWRKIPKPAGPEEILYGDKVISTRNDTRRWVYPREGAERYVANGDIGVVVGQFKGRSARWRGLPRLVKVEFGSQPGYTYDYPAGAFGDDGSPALELAYALTVHRAQGSEFTNTVVVIPDPCRQLSRELLYTALTRQRERVTVLYQGDPDALKQYARPERSETARRLTNLFEPPDPLPVADRFLERGVLHSTGDGRVVRSCSEVTIADCLSRRGVRWDYERKLPFSDGSFRYPTFTIEDDDAGIVVYWEHLTLLEDREYAQRWERKRAWYHEHEVWEATAERPQGGVAGLLVWTADDASGPVDATVVEAVAGRAFD